MLVQLNSVTKYFDGNTILNKINFKIEEGEKIGLVGVNGSGKSTLLSLLMNEMEVSEGSIYRNPHRKIGFVKQMSDLTMTNTIKEELTTVFSGLIQLQQEIQRLEAQMSQAETQDLETILTEYGQKTESFATLGGYEFEAKIDSIISGMGFNSLKETKIQQLSGGQKTKLSLAKQLLEEPDLLVLDEPTNHLDLEAILWLENFLFQYRGAILVVSHDRYFLDKFIQSVVELERNQITRYKGNYSSYVSQKEKNEQLHWSRFKQQEKEVKRLETYVEKHIVRATSAKSAKNKQKQLNRIDRIDAPLASLKSAYLNFEMEYPSHKAVLALENVALSVKPNELLLENVQFKIERGDRVALLGSNGVGKSTLLKSIIKELPYAEGSIKWGGNTKIGYYDQEFQSLTPELTVLEEMRQTFPKEDDLTVRQTLASLLFTQENVEKRIKDLSGGEKGKLIFAKLMLAKPNVLILDEPTNHLDLATKDMLEKSLINFEGTIFFVSHDRYFINKLATHVLELTPKKTTMYLGDYQDYLVKKE
ncbi:ABC-F family ATP-binding cassette domain-containing protein [Carnobacterium divergens]|uniref:ABC-F family ATP-binding cassette domain-containing protein n=1 Tax=Carnobacterium divergens TaxID=2748 RepID=UPI0039AFDDEB